MFSLTPQSVSRTTVVHADVPGELAEVPDVQITYGQAKFRPDRVWAEFRYRDGRGWVCTAIHVSGDNVLKSGATGKSNHSACLTGYGNDVLAENLADSDGYKRAPWAFQWAYDLVWQLDGTPVTDLSASVAVGEVKVNLDEVAGS